MISAILLKIILLSFLCFLSFKIPILLYLNSLGLFQETDRKLTVTNFITFLKSQIFAIELNVFNVQKYFVRKLKYQIQISSFKHVNAFLSIFHILIAERIMKIVS